MSDSRGASSARGGLEDEPRSLGDLVVSGGRLGWYFIGLVLSLYLVGVIAERLLLVVLPVLVALLLTTLLLPPAALLERAGLPHGLAAFLVVIGGLGVLIAVFGFVIPSFVEGLGNLRDRASEGAQQVLDWLAVHTPLPVDGMRLEELVDQLSRRVGTDPVSVTDGVLAGAVIAVEVVTGVVLALVLCFFFIKDRDRITHWLTTRTPSRQRTDMAAVGSRAWTTLSGYLRGTAIIALVDAAGIGLGLLLIGVPLVLPLSVLVFFGAFLPIVGAFVAGLAATLVALVTGGAVEALLALGVVVLVQQVEGNVLQPVVMSRAVPLHPVAILLAVTAGGALGGFVGAFVAVPIAAVLAASANELRERHPEAVGAERPEGGGAHKLKVGAEPLLQDPGPGGRSS